MKFGHYSDAYMRKSLHLLWNFKKSEGSLLVPMQAIKCIPRN